MTVRLPRTRQAASAAVAAAPRPAVVRVDTHGYYMCTFRERYARGMRGTSFSAGLLAGAVAQFTIGTDVLRFVWRHPANSGQRVRAVLRAIRYQAQEIGRAHV